MSKHNTKKEQPGSEDSQAMAVKSWLEEIGCSELFEAFVREKYADLETITLHVNERDLEAMGAKRAQVHKIMSGAKKLQEKLKGPTGKGLASMAFRALRTVVGSKEGDLSFEEGDDVILLERTSSERWKGRANRKEGYFPPDAILSTGETPPATEKTESQTGTVPAFVSPRKVPDNPESTATSLSTITPEQPPSAHRATAIPVEGSNSKYSIAGNKAAVPVVQETVASESKGTIGSQTSTACQTTPGSTKVSSDPLSTPLDSEAQGSSRRKEISSSEGKDSSTTKSGTAMEAKKSEAASSSLSHSNRDKSDKSSQQTLERTNEKLQDTQAVSSEPGKRASKTPKSDSDSGSHDQEHKSAKTEVQLTKTPDRKGLRVEFHVLIHPEWDFDPSKGHSVGIMFAHSWLGEWQKPAVTMETRERGTNGFLKLQGLLQLPPTLEAEAISYKYIVKCKKEGHTFEYIKAPTSKSKAVNRVLEIPKHVQGSAKGMYRKYDDVIRREQGILSGIAERFRGSRFVENRTVAIEMMLPKWPGFFCHGKDWEMTAEEALCEVDHVIQSIRNLRVWEDKLPSPHSWEPEGFSDAIVSKAVQKHLNISLRSFAEWKGVHSADGAAVVSSLVVAILITKYKLELATDEMAGLLNAMAVVPDLDNRNCPGYELLAVEFKDPRKTSEAVLRLCQMACSSGSFASEWLLALPLLHFLRGDSAPFQAPAVMPLNTPRWWGLANLYDDVKFFRKNKSSKTKSVLALADRLRPLFDVDPLSSRAFLYVINLEQVARCEHVAKSFEVINALDEKVAAATLSTSWFTGHREAEDTIKWLLVVVQSLLKQCLESAVDTEGNIEEMHRNAKSGIVTSLNLLRTVAGKFTETNQFKAILKCRDLFFAMMQSLLKISVSVSELIPVTEDGQEIGNMAFVEKLIGEKLPRAFHSVEEWLVRRTLTRPKTTKSLNGDLKLWSDVLHSESVEGCIEKEWSELIESSLKRKLLNVEPVVLMTASSQMVDSGFHQTIEKCLDFAIDKLSDRLPGIGITELENLVQDLISGVKKPRDQARSARTLGLVLRKRCPSSETPAIDVLRHLLSWKMWTDLLRFANDFPQARYVLGSNFDFIVKAERTLTTVVEKLANSDITMEELAVVNDLRTNLIDLCRQVDSMEKKNQLRHVAESSLQLRNEEQVEFRRQIELVNNFVAMCASLDLGTSPQLDLLSRTAKADVTKQPISRLCSREDSKQVHVHYFNISQGFADILDRLRYFSDSSIFKCYWRRQGDEARKQWQRTKQSVTLDIIATAICAPVFSQWQNLCKNVYDGSITLDDVAKTFNDFLRDRHRLQNELRCIHCCHNASGDKFWVEERATQMELFGKFAKLLDAARAMKQLSEVLMIAHRMKEVDSICSQDSESFRLRPITFLKGKLISASQSLDTVTEVQVHCLRSFASASALIVWLKNDIKEWKELESFVELAGAKLSGEGDYGAVKVAHLRGACAGYAHLLFNVRNQATFPELFEACKKVFEFLERDPQLPIKWLDTERNLEDFKVMRASLSSVEKSAFTDLNLINRRGEYHVGCIQASGASLGDEYTRENCIKVKIVAVQSERAAAGKVYWLTELQNIQSKLMLICGENHKSRNDVRYFVEVLNRAVRLASVFISLSNAGHCKYLKWNKTFRCRELSRASCLQPGVMRTSHSVELSDSELLQSLTKDADDMQKSLDKWIQEVEQHRSRFYHLNYFTTPQLLALRRQLGALLVNRQHQIPNETFCLLWSVAPSCTIRTLKETLSAASGLAATPTTSSAPTKVTSSIQVNEKVVRSLQDMGFSESKARNALLRSCGDVAMAVTLCLQPTDSDAAADAVVPFVADALSPTLASSSLELSCQRSGLDVEIVTGIAGEKPLHYLGMNTLGLLLERLASFSHPSPCRPFPSDQFVVGEANLVLVPRKDVLVSVLRLYMIDTRLPLPTAQEVLLCSPSTSAEEVCLFWRRAIGDPDHRRLFCLAMADRLSYEVSKKSVEDFNLLVQNQDASQSIPFRIVVVCAAESEDKSYVIDAFEAYRRHALPCVSVEHLRGYLKRKFRCSMDAAPVGLGSQRLQPAATLDHEQSSVRVVRSVRAGVGKSTFISMLAEGLHNLPNNCWANSLTDEDVPLHIAVPLHDRTINLDSVVSRLVPCSPSPDKHLSRIIHIDVSPLVRYGLEDFLFSLLILGEIADTRGHIWRRMPTDMYVVEITIAEPRTQTRRAQSFRTAVGSRNNAVVSLIDCMPTIKCVSPSVTSTLLSEKQIVDKGEAMNDREYRNSNFQRAFQYLRRFTAGEDLDSFRFRVGSIEGDHQSCLLVLLQNCGVKDPSWAEINYFVSFLSSQLRDCENNDFCNPDAYGEDLPGFKAFVMKFMIRMSRDFATPSLGIELSVAREESQDLSQYELRRRWEQSPHPYLFFNNDRHSMTFVGVQISRDGHLIDPQTGNILDTQMMTRGLSTALYTQGFRLQENYDAWDKGRKIEELSRVMGVTAFDHDDNYELTMDNVKKILAIQMRFRCGIPVVIMGETGCGKTRLIRYMCSLQANLTGAKNMLLMKVHGGVTHEGIIRNVQEAEDLATSNREMYGHKIQTVLFFDEANTTDALGLIKEIMCDKQVNGRKICGLGTSLQVIAACNPYRKHTEQMIRRLEEAGLGYHVRADKTEDRLGQIPLRQLVYRVHPLPESMQALVWDFGRLDQNIEKLYIKQIVSRHVERQQSLPNTPGLVDVITDILAAAQRYMRNRNDECSFVSLRDVERAMMITVRFYNLRRQLDPLMLAKQQQNLSPGEKLRPLGALTSSIVLGLAVSYHARLKERKTFRDVVAREFREPCLLPGGAERMNSEICYCQEVFLDELKLEPQIARNHALSENVFMMLICIDLRIPLFIVGKPGSSKSLAKDIVKTNMRGHLSHSELLKAFKQLHMVSYQCSPQSTAEGIISAFQQCQRVQKDDDTEHFVACVVLDEVGLAEDSPRLPLKALHPLLDDGTAGADSAEGLEEESRANRVAFVGLSNWALDPAKMNRGILVNREEPNDAELIVSAKGICSSDDETLHAIMPYLEGMAKAYRIIYEKQKKTREFFGLRDFYSLVKMVFAFSKRSQRAPSPMEMEHAIRRNFGGQDKIDVMAIFNRCCNFRSAETDLRAMPLMDNTTIGLIKSALNSDRKGCLGESRYVLLLTENYAALNIIRQKVVLRDDPVIIFGSGFPKDQEYTHICRTINRIKVCMETGRTVVLLNLDKLYESLYDALNQYYVSHGGQKFVDLGLGSHRVKCRVHEDFRLILVAERDDVYQHFPIPLINRMEKHFLAMKSVLSPRQQKIVERLQTWVSQFALVNPGEHLVERENQSHNGFKEGDAFVGYHEDTIATVVLQASTVIAQRNGSDQSHSRLSDDDVEDQLFDVSCRLLLNCATPDSVARLPVSGLSAEADRLRDIYFSEQHQGSLDEYVKYQMQQATKHKGNGIGQLLQITTHSRLLSSEVLKSVIRTVGVDSVALEQFDTEQQFCDRISRFYEFAGIQSRVLVLQCEAGDRMNDTVASVRYLVQEIRQEAYQRREGTFGRGYRHLLLILHVPRVAGGCFVGFQAGSWIEAHLDELRSESHVNILSVRDLMNRRLSSLLSEAHEQEEYRNRPLTLAQVGEESAVTGGAMQNRSSAHVARTVQLSGNDRSLLNSSAVIRACIHAAVSRLDVQQESIDKASQRVHILLELIPNGRNSRTNNCLIFFRELLRRVKKLLQERDEQMEANSADMWVRNEALSHSSIQAGGTFRRALWLRIMGVITPILSEIIASIDCNSNIRLLSDYAIGAGNWLSSLWLDLFCCSQFGPLQYDDFLSPVQNEMRQRVPVQSSGFSEHLFEAQFPFSHFVKIAIEEMVQEARSIAESRHERLDIVLERVVDSSSIGKIVRTALTNGGANKNELVDRYLNDFVHMMFNAESEEEHKLIKLAVVCGLNEMAAAQPIIDQSTGEAIQPAFSLSSIHVAFDYVKRRIYSFGEIVRHRTAIVRNVQGQITRESPEMLVDALAAFDLVEELHPNGILVDARRRSDWLKQVQKAKPLVESWLSLCGCTTDHQLIRTALVTDIRSKWTVLSALRLFVEHVQPLLFDPLISLSCLTFYQCLQSIDVDFTKEETLRAVQRFLDDTNKQIASKLIGHYNDQCAICLGSWTGKDPVSLPCGHVFCCVCIKTNISQKRSCPICQKQLPRRFSCRSSEQLKVASETYAKFKRCSTAFFMELVSVFSFSESAPLPPESGLVHMLMELVVQRRLPGTSRTRPFSPFPEDAIDSRPVVRSFILQLLLKYSTDQTLQYVEKVFTEAQSFLGAGRTVEMDDLEVIFVQCMEDALGKRACRDSAQDLLDMAQLELDVALNRLQGSSTTLDQLQGIASARFGLSITADIIGSILTSGGEMSPEDQVNNQYRSLRLTPNSHLLRKLLSKAKQVCNDVGDQQLLLFLVKRLVRCHGMDVMQTMRDDPRLRWICAIEQPQEREESVPDFFVVIQSPYLEIRQAVALVVNTNDTRHLDQLLKKLASKSKSSIVTSTLLALYKEVTTQRASRDPDKQVLPETLDLLEDYFNRNNHFPAWCKSLAVDLIRNAQGRPLHQLQVVPGQNIQRRALSGLALHVFITLTLSGASNILKPLHLILTKPQSMTNSYFPTMPEDVFMEARAIVQGTTWYQCKNGHPYLVANCGSPVVNLRCTDCGVSIGERSGDSGARTHDTTQTGHVLGHARQRSGGPTSERDLSPSSCALLRMLLHAALMWASRSQDQNVLSGIAQSVSPAIRQDDLPGFFWSHFEHDTVLLSKSIGRSVEDTAVVCHQMLNRLATNQGNQYEFSGSTRLSTREERRTWERAFNEKIISPLLQSMQNDINEWLHHVITDQSSGNNPLMRKVYELVKLPGSRFSPKLWRYRVPVSIDHLIHTIEQHTGAAQPNQLELLKAFLKEESKLRAVQYLPDIIKLQHLFVTKYHRRISKEEALVLTVDSFLARIHDSRERQMFESLIISFGNAWNLVKESVLNYGRLKPKKQEHELGSVTRKTPLAFLLPRPQEEGTCAVSLVDYLINCTHNEFLGTYRRIAGHEGNIERVPMEEVTKAQLVAYDVERDLMPLVFAHCDYSLAVGEGTKITYNLQALERQIIDRFLVGKPHVDMKVYRVAFRKEVYNVALFDRVRQRITQEEIPTPVQRQIISELQDVTDVYGVLAVLDIVIGFVASSGGLADTTLDHYIHHTLQMPMTSGLYSSKAKQFCQLKHVLALWRLLTVEKGRRLALADREPFEHIPNKYKEVIPPRVSTRLRKTLKKINLEAFLTELVEVITLELEQWEETNNIEEYELGAALRELHGSELAYLEDIPHEVELKHIIRCWNIAVEVEADITRLK